jgi:hypothetical protein
MTRCTSAAASQSPRRPELWLGQRERPDLDRRDAGGMNHHRNGARGAFCGGKRAVRVLHKGLRHRDRQNPRPIFAAPELIAGSLILGLLVLTAVIAAIVIAAIICR